MDFSAVANEIAKWPVVKEPLKHLVAYWPVIVMGSVAFCLMRKDWKELNQKKARSRDNGINGPR